MDLDKKRSFVQASTVKRKRFSKGGAIKKIAGRAYFDDGGQAYALGGPGDNGTVRNETNPNTGFLGSINSALGLNNNFQASGANVQQGTNSAQLNRAYNQVQGALGNQQDLTSTLTPGVGSAAADQAALAEQYGAMAQGQGPNPALMQLNQATGKNVANQAALMAGQRGAGANAGLIARQAAMQGAATQQDAAGQAATLQAQQQIAAQQNLANLATNRISQAGQAVTGLNSAQQNEQAMLQNANTSANNAAVGMQSNINNVNAQTSAANQNMAANTMGGIMSALSGSSAMSMLGAKGGVVDTKNRDHHLMLAEMNAHSLQHAKKFDEGGQVDNDTPNLGTFKASDDSVSSPNVASGSSLPADQTNFSDSMKSKGGGGGGGGGIIGKVAALFADGGQIQANPLVGGGGHLSNAMWGQANYNPGSASSGPNVAGSVSLPQNTVKFSEAMKKKKPEPDKKPAVEKEGEAGPWETGGGLAGSPGDDQQTNAAPQSPGAETADSSPDRELVAHGGQIKRNHFADYFAEGGKVPAMLSTDEVYLSPEKVHQVLHEGANPMEVGEKISGPPAKVKGDSLRNDVVPKTLEEGGVVVPRHITTHKMAPEKAELFVRRAMAKKKARG